jgi:hypothetical protein
MESSCARLSLLSPVVARHHARCPLTNNIMIDSDIFPHHNLKFISVSFHQVTKCFVSSILGLLLLLVPQIFPGPVLKILLFLDRLLLQARPLTGFIKR